MRKSDESDTTGLCAISSEVKQVAGYLLTFFISGYSGKCLFIQPRTCRVKPDLSACAIFLVISC